MDIQHPGQPEGPRRPEGSPPLIGKMAGRLFRTTPIMATFSPPLSVDRIAQDVDALARDALSSDPDILPEDTSIYDPRSMVVEAARTERVLTPAISPLFEVLEETRSEMISPTGTSYLLPDVDSPTPEPSEAASAGGTVYFETNIPRPPHTDAKDRLIFPKQSKIRKELRPYPEQIQGALIIANRKKRLPILEVERVEDITLDNLTAPIMIGTDKEGKHFVTICYESNGKVDLDVIYRCQDDDWTNARNATSQIFSRTQRAQEDAVRHEQIFGVPQSPPLIRYAKQGKLERRLVGLVVGEDVPLLVEIPSSGDYKQPDPNPGPTVHLYNPKTKNRVMPWWHK